MMTEEDTGESVAEDADLAVEAEDATAESEYVLDEILDEDELVRILEALLLIVDMPVSAEALGSATEQPAHYVAETLRKMADDYAARQSGIDLRETGGGWRMYTRSRYAPYVERLLLDGARSS